MQNQHTSKRSSCLIWALRIFGVLFVLTFVLFLIGYLTEKAHLARLPDKYPVPGEMVDVGEYSLHLHCMGEPSDKPVVVVSSGYSSSSLHWARVLPELAESTRVCAYDRPGSGYSFVDPEPRTYHQEAEELHTLLVNAGIEGPFVLVGHSYGGAVMQVYAIQYPEEVSGLVLVDANTRDAESRFPEEYVQAQKRFSQGAAAFRIPGLFRILNWFGIYKTDPLLEKLPADLKAVAYDLDYNSRMFTFQYIMNRADEEREQQFSAEGPLTDVPLIVITRGIPSDPLPGIDEVINQQYEQVWRELQSDLSHETSHGEIIVAEESGHNIIIDQPDIVIEAIHKFVEEIRSQ